MRIHRLRMQDFRGVADRELVFALDGVTIVEGPNEAGKTSVAEAIDLVLGVQDSSTAQKVKDVRPAGRDVGPRVEIELTTGPYHLVLAKRWLHQKETTLTLTAPRHEHLVGREAHQRVQQILAETLDADLWAALRLPQGSELTQAAFDTPTLARALDLAAGGQVAGAREDDLLARVAAEHERYWTPGGKPKVDRVDRAATVAAAAAHVADLERQLADLDDHVERVAALGRGLDELGARRQECRDEMATADAAWMGTEEAQRTVASARQVLSAAVARHDGAREVASRRDELVDDATTARAQLDKLVAERERAAPELVSAEARADLAASEAATIEGRLAVARGAADAARAHLAALRTMDELDEWRARAVRIGETETALSQALSVLESVPVDAALLPVLDQAQLRAAEAAARLEVAGARVTAHVHAPVELRVDGATDMVLVGDERAWVATDRWTLQVDDRLTVVVEPGQDARQLARAAEVARQELEDVLRAAGVDSIDEARERVELRRRAEAAAATARADLHRDLGDLTPALVAEQVAQLEATVAGHLDTARPGRPATIGTATAAVEDADRAVRALDDALAERVAEEQSHRDRVADARLQDRLLDGRITQAHEALAVVEGRLETARATASDEAVRAAVAATEAEVADARATQVAAEARLAALDPDGLRARLDNARATVRRVEAEISAAAEERQRLATTLEVLGDRGLASELDAARTRLAHLERDHERVEARAAAAALLHRTFDARRRDARQRYAEPFRQQIQRLGRIVFGPTVEIELDDELRIARRILDGVALDFDQLSVGAREQLGILARLACASIVSTDGGAPVIFDDVLGYTDPERLRTMGTAIAASSAGCQVIVLTCTPSRYTYVGDARVISLA